MKLNNKFANFILNAIFVLLCIMFVFPIVLVISVSFTADSSISMFGYKIIPAEFTLDGYKYIFGANNLIFNAYGITIFVTVLGTIAGVFIMTLYAYGLSRKEIKGRNFFTFYAFFTMLFNGGLVATYMVCTRMLKLTNTIWALILPMLVNSWNIIILKNFFVSSVPTAIIESGKLDGAGEYKILFKLVFPIAVPGIATVALFTVLGYWNDWIHALLYITDYRLYNLQFLLQNMMANIQQMSQTDSGMGNELTSMFEIPADSARMALCVVAMGPILVVYPFFQRYFIQGLTVGAVKG